MNTRLAAGLIAAVFCAVGCRRQPAVEIFTQSGPPDHLQQSYWPLPDFSLTDRNGQMVSLRDLNGKVWVADFFYSTCPGPCPMLTSRLSEVQKQLGADDRVRLVSNSADPEKDTPEVLRQYATKFHASDRWLFLTGSKDAIRDLAQNGFKLPVAEMPGAAEPITHSTRLVLVDQTGTIRGLYEGVGGDGPGTLVRDIHRLLETKP